MKPLPATRYEFADGRRRSTSMSDMRASPSVEPVTQNGPSPVLPEWVNDLRRLLADGDVAAQRRT